MKIKQKYILIVFALSLFQLTTGIKTVGQEAIKVQEKCLYHFDDLQRKQTWTESYNGAGLHFIDFSSSSFIEAYFGKNNGSLVKYYDSENSLDYGLRTSSYTKIKKTTFYGSVDYNNFIGQDMRYSGLIYPERYLLSVANDNPAEKRKESYKLNGGFATPITKNLFFGFQINYETANMSKMKDLRHNTKLLDFETTAGLIWTKGSFNFGANYYYRKFHEDVTFSKVTDDEVLFNGYLYKGLWFGLFDNWSDEALNLSRPFTDVLNGGSVQIEYVKNNFRFHNEITYKRQEGMTGPGADRAYSESQADIYEYKGVLQLEQENLRHYLRLKSKYEDAVNYDKVTNSERIGGMTIIYYYGLNKAFSRRNYNLNAQYELAIGGLKCNPDWDISAEYNYMSAASLSSLIAPFYFTQDMQIHSFAGKVRKNFLFDKGMIDLSLSGGFSKGDGNRLKQHMISGASDQITEDIIPDHSEDLLKREFEYMTAGKAFGEIGFRYSKFIVGKNNSGSAYLDASYSMTKASTVIYHDSDNAGIFKIAIGYSF
jgi:hypothetical protein